MMKYLKLLLVFAFCFSLTFSLSSCFGGSDKPTNNEENKTTEVLEPKEEQYKIYKLALKSGFNGTYEEWLDSIKGDKVVLKVDDNKLLWKYSKDKEYQELIDLKDLAGNDGREIELNVSLTHLQWHYKGQEGWFDLISLEDLKGNDGKDGKSAYELAVETGFKGTVTEWLESLKGKDGSNGNNGREVEFQVTLEYIQWHYVGEAAWKNLIALNSLKGADGEDGTNGTNGESAYDIAVSQGFKGTVTEWLESLKGQNGSNGNKGEDGNDGREVEFKVTLEAIEWHYVGEETWTQLVKLESLKGADGSNGTNGESAYDIAVSQGFKGTLDEWLDSLKGIKGKEVEFRLTETAIAWHYVGEETWNELITLASIKGESGNNGKSAYEIYLEAHPEYTKSEAQWLEDLVNGNLANKTTYTVRFITGTNLVINDQKVIKGELVNKVEQPEKLGYRFLGWYIDDERWVFNAYPVLKDLTLEARFEEIKEELTFTMSDLEVTYDGLEHTIYLNEELPANLSIRYIGQDKFINAGTYEVAVIIYGDNFETKVVTANLTINKLKIEDPEFKDKEVTYNGKAQSILITSLLPEGILVTYKNNEQTEVGSYDVEVKFNDTTGNYEIVKSLTAKLTIKPQRAGDYSMNNLTVIYDGKEHSLQINEVLPEGFTVTYTNNYQVNAGTYEVLATITNPNYETKIVAATLTINKAKFDVTFESKTFIYNGYVQRIVVIGEPEGTDIKYTNNEQKEVGKYSVTATLTNPNYETLVLKATLTISNVTDNENVKFVDNVFKYDGKPHSLTVENIPDGLFVTYVNNEQTSCGRYEVVAIFSSMQGKVLELKAILTISMDGLPIPEEDVYFRNKR